MTTQAQREEMIRRLKILKTSGHENFNKDRNKFVDYNFIQIVLEVLEAHESILKLAKTELNW